MSPSLKTYRVDCYDAGNRIITNSWVEASKWFACACLPMWRDNP
jgi:hypothetical protein